MRWEYTSKERFVEHQEYVDTAIIPLVKLELGERFSRSLSLATWLTGIAHAVEEQLTGRVMLFPQHNYVETIAEEKLNEDLSLTSDYFKQHKFKHVVYVSIENELVQVDSEHHHLLAITAPKQDEENNWQISKQLMEIEAQKLVPQLINLWQK